MFGKGYYRTFYMTEIIQTSNWENPARRKFLATKAAHERNEDALLDLVRNYMRLKSRKRTLVSPATIDKYALGIRDFIEWAWPVDSLGPRVNLLKVTSDDLDRYIGRLQVEGGNLGGQGSLKPSSISTYISGVRTLYKAFAWADVAEFPSVVVPGDPTPAHERRPALPADLYKKLLSSFDLENSEGNRDYIAARLMGEAGLRISEVTGLLEQDLFPTERLLNVKRGKGGKSRTVPLSRSLNDALSNWLLKRRVLAAAGDGHVIINLGGRKGNGKGMTEKSLRETFNHYYRALDFPTRYYGAHMLRHTAGTRIYKVSRDLHATARLLGHSNVNTSAIYAKMDMEGLYDIVDKMEE